MTDNEQTYDNCRVSGGFPEGRGGLDAIWNIPKITPVDYPHTTPEPHHPKSRSKWIYLPSSAKDHHSWPEHTHRSSSTSEHASSSTPTLSHDSIVVPSLSVVPYISIERSISLVLPSVDLSSILIPSVEPISSIPIIPSSTPAASSSLVITPTPISSPEPLPSCTTAPAAVIHFACDVISTACSCLSLISATPTSTATTTSIVSHVLDSLNTIIITIQSITTLTVRPSILPFPSPYPFPRSSYPHPSRFYLSTFPSRASLPNTTQVPAVFDTTTPTRTGTDTSTQIISSCPCAAPTRDLCGDTAAECLDLRSDVGNCGRCGNACDPGVECRGGMCVQGRGRVMRGV